LISNRATGLGNMDCPCVSGPIAKTLSRAPVFQKSRQIYFGAEHVSRD
jgi:hypothetical protein